jgi:hypothetical protein
MPTCAVCRTVKRHFVVLHNQDASALSNLTRVGLSAPAHAICTDCAANLRTPDCPFCRTLVTIDNGNVLDAGPVPRAGCSQVLFRHCGREEGVRLRFCEVACRNGGEYCTQHGDAEMPVDDAPSTSAGTNSTPAHANAAAPPTSSRLPEQILGLPLKLLHDTSVAAAEFDEDVRNFNHYMTEFMRSNDAARVTMRHASQALATRINGARMIDAFVTRTGVATAPAPPNVTYAATPAANMPQVQPLLTATDVDALTDMFSRHGF